MDRISMIDLKLGKEELDNITEAIRTGWISSKGKYIAEFENSFAKYIGAKHGVSTTNGTAALHLALVALGIGKGDEVLVQSFTHVSNAFAVTYTGAEPVFLDSHPDYWCVDPSKIEEKITKKTKALIIVDIYGHPCDMDPILKITKRHGIRLVEDAAEAHGAEYKGRKAGTFGDINCFSFYANKLITTGEGGMCLTDNDSLASKMRMLKDLRRKPEQPDKEEILV